MLSRLVYKVRHFFWQREYNKLKKELLAIKAERYSVFYKYLLREGDRHPYVTLDNKAHDKLMDVVVHILTRPMDEVYEAEREVCRQKMLAHAAEYNSRNQSK